MTDVAEAIRTAENGAVPRPSLAERDRRHAALRAAMARDKLDALILSPSTQRWAQMMADSRYVTAIGSFETEVLTVVPREGEITAFVYNRADWWRKAVDWIGDVRDGRNEWGRNVVERLTELGLPAKARIGISGLSGLSRAPSGTVTWATVDAVGKAFPNAGIVNATALMQDLRAIKSDEEVSFLARSASIVEKMIATCVESARPGIREKQLYARMTATLLEEDGELPNFLLFATGPGLARSSFVPTNRVLATGDRIINEIEAKYAGYGAQAVAPMILGKAPASFRDAASLAAESFNAILAAMKPGVTFGDLQQVYEGVVAKAGGRYGTGFPMLHARGLGDDGPALLGKKDLETFKKIPLQKGMTFILKPRVIENGGAKERVNIGDTVAVTANGAKRLGKRPLELIEIG
jgi:Xaa-Pro aminopeptidase